MPVDWRWYNDQHTIVCFTFKDPWTLDEFIIADTQAGQAIKGFEGVVDAIMDLSQAHLVPRNMVSGLFSMARRSESVDNMGSSIVINASQLLRTLLSALQKLTSQNAVIIADDFDDAEQIIADLPNKRARVNDASVS